MQELIADTDLDYSLNDIELIKIGRTFQWLIEIFATMEEEWRGIWIVYEI